MFIVELMGGLGNQMFQYALARHLSLKNNTEFKMDLEFLSDRTPRENFVYRNFDIDIFNIIENFVTKDELKNIAGEKKEKIVREKYFHFDPSILNLPDNSYISGYWQTEKYFKDIEDILRKEFSFRNELPDKAKKLRDKILSTNSVCINVRRTDYITNPTTNKFHGVCGMEYFNSGINYLRERVSDLHFFVFSDDIEWCIKNFPDKSQFTAISHEYTDGKFSNDLCLMSMCSHFIISNSTFGWWAVWLNTNTDKITIAPKSWFANSSINTCDLIPHFWIRL